MRTVAVWSAILSYAVLVAVVVGAGSVWPEYDHARNYISELGATGAPHGRLVSLWGFIPSGLLLMLFSVAALVAAPRSLPAVLGFALLFLYAAGLFAAGVYPCDAGCSRADPSFAQTMHDLWGAPGYLLAPVMMALLGVAARKWPGAGHLFPIGLVAAVATAAALPLVIGENEWRGLAQRVLEGAVGTWVLLCALWLARRPQAAETDLRANRPPALA